MKSRLWIAGAITAIVTLAACGSTAGSGGSGTSGGSGASGSGIRTASTGIGTVLTDSRGFTLYWFAPDTSTASRCSGGCAAIWPPVKGPASAASGVSLPGHFGTIKRSDGTMQATYDGHPLYTYTGDTSPGQTNGNGLNASGGLWTAMTPSGSAPAPAPGSSSSSSGGYGSGGGGGY